MRYARTAYSARRLLGENANHSRPIAQIASIFAVHVSCIEAGHEEQRFISSLQVWRDAMTLVEDMYRISKGFPSDERFGLTAQLRRAAVSIPSNIGEGKRRKRQRAFLHHLDIALGFQGEVNVQLELAFRLGFLARTQYDEVVRRVDEVGRMLNGLIESMQPRDEREP